MPHFAAPHAEALCWKAQISRREKIREIGKHCTDGRTLFPTLEADCYISAQQLERSLKWEER